MYVYVLLQYFAHITGQPGISYRAKTFADFLAISFLLSFFESQSLNHFATISSCKKAITIAIEYRVRLPWWNNKTFFKASFSRFGVFAYCLASFFSLNGSLPKKLHNIKVWKQCSWRNVLSFFHEKSLPKFFHPKNISIDNISTKGDLQKHVPKNL